MHLSVAKADGGSFRQCVKGVSWPIRESEWDTPGGFTNGGPGDSQMRFPRSFVFHAVTTPLKRPFMLQPVVEDRSVQVVIDGEHTGQSQRLMEPRFGSASRRSRGRSGSESESAGVTYIMRAFHLTQANSPISLFCLWLRPDPRTPAPAARTGKSEVDGSDPPFCCPDRARGRCAIHICATPPGGSLPSH